MAVHGKWTTYSNGCRCELCREAWRVYRVPKVMALRRQKRAERIEAGVVPMTRAEAGRLGGQAKARNARQAGDE